MRHRIKAKRPSHEAYVYRNYHGDDYSICDSKTYDKEVADCAESSVKVNADEYEGICD